MDRAGVDDAARPASFVAADVGVTVQEVIRVGSSHRRGEPGFVTVKDGDRRAVRVESQRRMSGNGQRGRVQEGQQGGGGQVAVPPDKPERTAYKDLEDVGVPHVAAMNEEIDAPGVQPRDRVPHLRGPSVAV